MTDEDSVSTPGRGSCTLPGFSASDRFTEGLSLKEFRYYKAHSEARILLRQILDQSGQYYGRQLQLMDIILSKRKTVTVSIGAIVKAAIVAILFILIALVFHTVIPSLIPGWYFIDWRWFFRPAVMEMLSGGNPYTIGGFYGPPWILLLLSPFALLSESLGGALIAIIALCSFGFVAFKMRAGPWILALFIFSPHVLKIAINGNVDWMVALGFLMPPQIGLFFVSAKPQLGFPVAIFWLYESWRKGGITDLLKTSAPVSIAFLVSFALYGLWPLRFSIVAGEDWNIAPWPFLIPFGIILLVYALRHNQKRLAVLSAPFLTPYMVIFSLPVAMLGILPSQEWMLIAIAGLWLLEIVTGYPF